MTPTEQAILNLGISMTTFSVMAPFMVALNVRRFAARGTRLHAMCSAVVVPLRPLIRPAIVVWSAFQIIKTVLGPEPEHIPRSVQILLWLVIAITWWHMRNDDIDDDDDRDPWRGLARKVRGVVVRLVPGGQPASSRV